MNEILKKDVEFSGGINGDKKPVKGTLEHFLYLGATRGFQEAKRNLRNQFQNMELEKFERLWATVQKQIPNPQENEINRDSNRKEMLYDELSLDSW